MPYTNHVIADASAGEIRGIARSALKGHWGRVIPVFVIYMLLNSVLPAFVNCLFPQMSAEYTYPVAIYGTEEMTVRFPVFYFVYSALMNGVLAVMAAAYLLAFLRYRKTAVDGFFGVFRYFLKALVLSITDGLIIYAGMLFFILPGIIFALALSQAPYILADNPEKGVFACIGESWTMMRGNKASYFLLILSFIGWALLGGLAVYMLELLLSPLMPVWTPGEVYDLTSSAFAESVILLAVVPLTAYIKASETVFYEIASGHLHRSVPLPPLYPNYGPSGRPGNDS